MLGVCFQVWHKGVLGACLLKAELCSLRLTNVPDPKHGVLYATDTSEAAVVPAEALEPDHLGLDLSCMASYPQFSVEFSLCKMRVICQS